MGKYNLARSLVSRQLEAVLLHVVLCTRVTFLDLDDSRCLLAKTLVRKTDDRDILDRLEGVQEVSIWTG